MFLTCPYIDQAFTLPTRFNKCTGDIYVKQTSSYCRSPGLEDKSRADVFPTEVVELLA
jgi:hypothetical protein